MPAQTIIKLRRGTAAEWASANPILASGEAGVETDTNQLKIGDGTTVWNSLPYITGGSGAATIVSETEPAATIEGGLWYKPSTQRLYIYIEGTGWSLVPTEGIIAQAAAPGNTDVLWLDTDEPGDAVLPLAGTAGQVLAKIDSADYNTEWTTLTATDISDLTASAAAINTIDDGTAGYTALSNGTAGITYQPVSHNYIINGAFDVWQRGTSFDGASFPYLADRWRGGNNAVATFSRQTTSLNDFQYALRLQRDSGATSTTALQLRNTFETVNSIPLAGKTVTLSVYARAGADFSGSGMTLTIQTGTGTDQSPYSGLTGAVNNGLVTPAITTDWVRYTTTATLPTNATQIAVGIQYTPSGTAGANDWMEITGVQLEAGSVATPFKRHAPSLQGELAACQRYYYRARPGGAFTVYGLAVTTSTTSGQGMVQLPVTMRVTPTSIDFSNLGYIQTLNDTTYAISAASLNPVLASPSMGVIGFTVATVSALQNGRLASNNSVSGFIGFSAEL